MLILECYYCSNKHMTLNDGLIFCPECDKPLLLYQTRLRAVSLEELKIIGQTLAAVDSALGEEK